MTLVRTVVAIGMISIVGTTNALASDACAAAIDYGKWMINNCIEDGIPGCRTANILDMVWEQALAAERPMELGGCYNNENLLCDIYWDGTPSDYGACGASVGQF